MQTIKKLAKDIKEIKIQGAIKIAQKSVEGLNKFGQKSKAKTKKQFISELQRAAKVLIGARPTEPAMQNSLDSVITVLKKSKNPDFKKELNSLSKNKITELKQSLDKITENTLKIIPDRATILLHCHSHTVIEAVRAAKKKRIKVILTETRPRFQGRLTAKDMVKAGIPATMITDDAVSSFIRDVDLVLVGTDAVTKKGIINKIGTKTISIVAKKYKKPVYVLGSTLKFIKEIKIEQRNPKEVWDRPPKKLKIKNPAFDLTPYEYVKGVITEKGVFSPRKIKWRFLWMK